MTSVSGILILVRSLARTLGDKLRDADRQLVGATQDLEAASDSNVCISTIVVCNPHIKDVVFHEMQYRTFIGWQSGRLM